MEITRETDKEECVGVRVCTMCVCVCWGLLSGTDIITACNIFNSRLSRSVAAFRDLTLSHCRPERQQTDFIYCN